MTASLTIVKTTNNPNVINRMIHSVNGIPHSNKMNKCHTQHGYLRHNDE